MIFFGQCHQAIIQLMLNHHAWMYLILFSIIFSETAFLIAALLPGDSLIIATGAVVAKSPDVMMSIHLCFLMFIVAAISGNAVNYFTARWLGPKVFTKKHKYLNKKYVQKSHRFYKKWGGGVIVISSFIPIMRTISPFLAGLVKMRIKRFFIYNILGSILWVGILLYSSFYLGKLPAVKEHFTFVIWVIIILTVLSFIFHALTLYIRSNHKK